MPMLSVKNMMLSPAATDLGLGDSLAQQVAETEAERKKRLLAQQSQQVRSLGQDLTGSGAAAMQLFPGAVT